MNKMLVFSGVLVLLFALVVPSLSQTGTPCPPVPGKPSCVCKSDKGIIDLTSLANTDGTARFTGLQDPNYYTYSYNPCQPFKGKFDCTRVHVCQISNFDPTLAYDIADPKTEQMHIDTDGTPYLHYTGPDNRVVQVFLHCDRSQNSTIATTDGDSKKLIHYVFNITGRAVCPGGGGRGVAPGEI